MTSLSCVAVFFARGCCAGVKLHVKNTEKMFINYKMTLSRPILTFTRVINYKIIRKFVNDFAVLRTVAPLT